MGRGKNYTEYEQPHYLLILHSTSENNNKVTDNIKTLSQQAYHP